ncbi:MAG: hypothetical protein LDL47_05545 [Cyanobacteria bacterium KgW148]|nr:hypothetical protein [Cyanobacteria bacterium KgW148]
MKRRYTDRFSWSTLGLTGGAIVLTIANWRLVFTLLCGITVMTVIYCYPRSFNPNQRLKWAVLGGSASIFACYLLLMLLEAYPNSWLGLGEVLEFIAVFTTLGLVLYQNLTNKRPAKTIDQLILYLASEDPLTRLIGLRQLQQRVVNQSLSFQQEQQLKEYCQIILEQQQSEALRDTALETMEMLQFVNLRPKLKSNSVLIVPKEVA